MAVALDDEGAPSIIPSGLPSFGPTSGLLAGGDAAMAVSNSATLTSFPSRFRRASSLPSGVEESVDRRLTTSNTSSRYKVAG